MANAPDKSRQITHTSRPRLYLIDAMALAYRAYFAFISRPLINSKGLNTSAIYGFVLSLLKILETENPEYIAVVFDPEGGTFREEMYAEYKAHRSPMPEDLRKAVPVIKEIVRAFRIPVLEVPGMEADDVIGTLAHRAEEEGVDVVIVSPDKDFLQLLDTHISLLKPKSRGEDFERITLEDFREKYGVEPRQFIDILALIGDASDNVPGVRGIGQKTAPALIQQYGSVERLLEHAEEISKKRIRENLLHYREEALLSKQLVTIRTDAPLDIEWQELRREVPDVDRLIALFKELEFPTLIERIQRHGRHVEQRQNRDSQQGELFTDMPLATLDDDSVDYRQVRTQDALKALAQVLNRQKRFALDTETTATDPMWASLVGVSFAWEPGSGRYVPVPDAPAVQRVLQTLEAPLTNEHILKVGQNLKYDWLVLARHGVPFKGPLFDTMVAHYLLEPEQSHALENLARKYLRYDPVSIQELIGSGREQLSMREVDVALVSRYACEDADITLQLAEILREELKRENLLHIAEEMEFPLVYVLGEMEWIGMKVDEAILQEISEELEAEIKALEQRIFAEAGETFNINSPRQLAHVLFDRLGLKPIKKTKTGQYSTNEQVLQELATQHPLPGLVLDWRRLTKLKSTYVDALPRLIHPETGRIHTSFNQTVTATGRLSSSNPNLQNIPIRGERGREIRRAFVPEEGFLMMVADYAQIEMRIIAALSGDPGLKEAFEKGLDIHTATAARVFKVPLEEVTPEMRSKVKQVNYGIPYGISPYGLAQRLRIPIEEARELIKEYHRSYPYVSQLLHDLVERARERGYAETLLGRRRYIPEINAPNRAVRSAAERIAVNMPIQGTQADMIKLAMVHIHRQIQQKALKSRLILQVHDELVFEVPPEELETVQEVIKHEMEHALKLDVPIVAKIGVGKNWLEAADKG